jgi:hypothetical protein
MSGIGSRTKEEVGGIRRRPVACVAWCVFLLCCDRLWRARATSKEQLYVEATKVLVHMITSQAGKAQTFCIEMHDVGISVSPDD